MTAGQWQELVGRNPVSNNSSKFKTKCPTDVDFKSDQFSLLKIVIVITMDLGVFSATRKKTV